MSIKSLSKRLERLADRIEGAAVPPLLFTIREESESDEEARARALAPYSPKDLAKIVVVCLDQGDAEL